MFRYGFPKLRAVKMTDEHTSICQFTEPMTVKMEHRLEAGLVPKDDNSGDRTFCPESRSSAVSTHDSLVVHPLFLGGTPN